MKLKLFIDRPVLSAVISIVIVLAGLVGLRNLAVEQYPDMAPPTVNVWTTYPGANAETVQKAVVVPLEEAINGVEGMTYITSTASNTGEAQLMVYFRQSTNADMAAVNVQNRVQQAMSLLPAEVTRMGVTTNKQQNAELKTFALYSKDDSYDQQFLNNYMKINVEPRIKRVPGVGNTMLLGSNYSMRVWLKPERMHAHGLVPSDVAAVIGSQNLEAATGEFGENHDQAKQYAMKYRGRLSTPEEFGDMVVKAQPTGELLRLRDVADIELGDEAYNYRNVMNGHPLALMIVNQTAGSNAAQTINEIDRVLDELSGELPDGLEFVTLSDANQFLYASIANVVETLLVAILLVVLVVYFFLQDLRSTLIPTVAIFVSIIGTFAVLWVIGFTINLLTLFAIVLAIGTVVDDAIVVVEAVQARFDEGCRSPYEAAVGAMSAVAPAILTSTLIFMSVFLPVAMMGGTSGEFYKQFGLTMAIAVGISAINAFTLSPALCALILKPYLGKNGEEKNNFAARFRRRFNRFFERTSARYSASLLFFIKRRLLVAGTLAAGLLLLFFLINNTKTGLVPDEDTGSMMVTMSTPPGTSLAETNRILEEFGKRLEKIEAIEYHADVTGFSFDGSGSTQAMSFIGLRHWNLRKGKGESADAVMDSINAICEEFPGMEAYAAMPPMIPGYGMSGGIELYVQDRTDGDLERFKEVADRFIDALSQRPELEQVFSSFKTDHPQYWVDVNAAECLKSGTTPEEVLATLSGYFSGDYVSNFNRFSKIYRVMMQADPAARVDESSLENIYTRVGNSGASVPFSAISSPSEMAPLSHFLTLTKTNGPADLTRFNLFNAIPISAMPADGYSSGDALQAVKEVAAEVLPAGYGYEFGGLSREEAESEGNATVVFGICLLLMYLILCALYESFLLPLAVVLPVPCGLVGSFLAAQIFGLENNIYMQTGIIMLIGLLSKTAILITEYAIANRRQGATLRDAAMTAARVRFRPILMTALTMIFGLVPLMLSTGVGARGNFSLATPAVFGMALGTLALLILVPPLFTVCMKWQEKIRKHYRFHGLHQR